VLKICPLILQTIIIAQMLSIGGERQGKHVSERMSVRVCAIKKHIQQITFFKFVQLAKTLTSAQ